MKVLGKILRWSALAVGVALFIAAAGAVIYSHTDGFRELIRREALTAINQTIRGRIDVERVEGSVWGNLTLVAVRVSHGGNDIARVPRLQIQHSLLPLLWGSVRIFRLSATDAELWLKQDPQGEWNLVDALAPVDSKPSEPSKLLVSVHGLELERARVDLQLANQQRYAVRDLEVRGEVGVQPSGIAVGLHRVAARVASENMPEIGVAGHLAYQNQDAPESLEFKEFQIDSGDSILKATGVINDLSTPIVKARLVLVRLAPADVSRFVAQWPVKADLSGTADIQGPLAGLEGSFSLAAAGGSLTGTFAADVTADEPVYRTGLRLSGIDSARLLQRTDVRGVLNGVAQLRGHGFMLAGIDGNADVAVRGAEIAGRSLGVISAKAELREQAVSVIGQIQGDLGSVQWRGRLGLNQPNAYDAGFSGRNLDVRGLLRSTRGLDGKLNLDGTIRGSGFTLVSGNAQAIIKVLNSQLRGVDIQQGSFVIALADQRIRIAEASMRAGDTTLSASGDVGVNPKQPGKLEYRFRVGELAPWLAMFGQQGSGAVMITGSADGTLAAVKTRGKIALSALRLQGATVRTGRLAYDMAYANSQPEGVVSLDLSGVERDYRLENVQGTVKMLSTLPYTFDIDLRGRDTHGRVHTVAAAVKYAPPQIALHVTNLTATLPDGMWKLAQPATMVRHGDEFRIDQLTMRNNQRSVSVDGRFSLAGAQALRAKIDGVPLHTLRGFYPDLPEITGNVSGRAQLTGTASAPEIEATVKLDEATIAGQRYRGLSAALSYVNAKADLKGAIEQDQSHRLDVSGSMPLALSWARGWRFEPGNITARAHSPGLSVAFLNAFSGKAIRGIDGRLAVDLQVRGTLAEPTFDGFVRLKDGRLTPVDLGIDLSAINAEARLARRGITVTQLMASANGGKLSGSGFVALDKFTPQAIDMTLTAARWPAVNTQQYQADVTGSVNIKGKLMAPQLTGKLEVVRALLRPDLAFLKQGNAPTKRDPTIKLVGAKAPAAAATVPAQKPPPPDNDLWKSAAVNLEIVVPNNAWLRHANANVELSGTLNLQKPAGADPAVTGLLETVRGWVGFQGRRFNLTRGVVQFNRTDKINPVLDVVGEYRAGEYAIQALISGNAQKPVLTLSSQPQMEQSDILAVLLFGKPVAALNQGEAASLQQSAINVASGFAASHVVRAVSQALNLQELGLDLSDVEVAEGRVRVGRYVGDKTFFSVSQQISGNYGQEVSVEFRITPDWKLGVTSSSEGTGGVDVIWHKRY